MSLNIRHVRDLIIRPALARLALPGEEAAVALILGTGAKESGYRDLAQRPVGPALGFWQIEPATHEDLWANFLKFRPELAERAASLAAPGIDRAQQLAGNPLYAAAIARLLYFRHPDPLPAATDVAGMARLWKRVFNTGHGKGREEEFVQSWRDLVAPAIA